MIWFLWTIFLLQFCRIVSSSLCKVPGFICTVTSQECPSELTKERGNHDVIWNIDKFEIEPYQKTMVTDFENKYYPGLSIEIVKDISRRDVRTLGVQLSISPLNGTERCITMFARNDSFENGNILTKKITFNLDFYPFGNDYIHSVFRAYSYEGNRRSRTYAEQRVSLQSAGPAPTPENSSKWTTTIVYQIDSKSQTVSCTFAYPPSSLNMTHFIVSLQKLVTAKVPSLGGEERRKTKEEQLIDTNHYTFANVSGDLYRIYVMPWDIKRKPKTPSIPRQRKTTLCKSQGKPSKCRESFTDIFEVKDGLVVHTTTKDQRKNHTIATTTTPTKDKVMVYENHTIATTTTPTKDKSTSKHPTEMSSFHTVFTSGNPVQHDVKEGNTQYLIIASLVCAVIFVTIIGIVCSRRDITRNSRNQHEQEFQNRKNSLLTWASQPEQSIVIGRADSGIDSTGIPEYLITTNFPRRCTDHCNESDITSMAVTIGGGMSAPPEPTGGSDMTRQEDEYDDIKTETKENKLGISGYKDLHNGYDYIGDEISL